MIQIANLFKSYGSQELFREVTFSINAKERIGLVGRNGHGKTTLFRLLLRAEEPDAGTISFPKNYRVGYLDQHVHFTRASVLEEACLGLPEDQKHEAWKAEKILFGLGFTADDLPRPPAEFSGGFQVRLNLAKVLVSEPNLLLLDEPTNYLDVVSIRWLIRFLRAWPGELMLITHDRSFMDSVITHCLGIHRKRVRKVAGTTQKLYDQILADEEVYEKTRLNDEKRRREVEVFIRRFRAKARLANLVQSRIKTLQKQQRKEKLEKIETLEFAFQAVPFAAKVMLEAENLSFAYEPSKPLFENVNFTVGKHDRICIVGKNGKGKTTLLKVLAGELSASKGIIRRHPGLRTAYFEQTNTARLDPQKTVEEEIRLSNAGCTHQLARDVAGAMMFSGDAALKKVSVLSGGEKSRVLLGKLLVSPSHLLLLDEPTNHLDMESCDSLLAAIDSFDGAVILVTHNEMFLHSLANRLIVFDGGRTFLYEGAYQSFLHDVGWDSDENHSGKSPRSQEDMVRPNSVKDKKVLRKRKAEIVQERSQTLKPLQRRIADLESEIERLEADLSRTIRRMVEASTRGDGEAIARLAREEKDIQARLESSYEELTVVTDKCERLAHCYARKLQEFR